MSSFAGNKENSVCPWWICWVFDNQIRGLLQNPRNIVSPYIKPGDTVIDVGPGMGFFTIPMAEIVGENGRVIAVDIQKKMLDHLMQRVENKGFSGKVSFHLSTPGNETPDVSADFILAFWMVHEVPDKEKFLYGLKNRLKQGGLMLIVEPKMHVTKESFEQTVGIAEKIGFKIKERPDVSLSRAVLLLKV
jgi:ubiquinone/menaquinone biosynthesis C-methylase UbiE